MPKSNISTLPARDQMRADLDLPERALLRHFAENADLLDLGLRPPDSSQKPRHWLVVPVTQSDLDLLARFEADREDIESDADFEPDGDAELSIVRPDTMSRVGIDDDVCFGVVRR